VNKPSHQWSKWRTNSDLGL